MDLDAIAVFVKVVEAGSFSGAARLLQMPNTTVSAKVANLERRLGVTLIQRTTRKLHVTDVGRNYFHHCAQAIKAIEQGESELVAEQETPKGLLRITAPGDLGNTLLPRIVSEYLKRFPETEIELIVTNRMVDLVGEGVDLAIRAGDLKDSTLIAKRFIDIQVGLWATPAYLKKHGTPEHPRDLANHQMITHATLKFKNVDMTDEKSVFTVATKARIRTDDFQTIKALVSLKEGIGWLPDFMVPREVRSKEFVQVLPKWRLKNSGGFWFVYPGQKYSSPKVRAFIEMAAEKAKRDCQSV